MKTLPCAAAVAARPASAAAPAIDRRHPDRTASDRAPRGAARLPAVTGAPDGV